VFDVVVLTHLLTESKCGWATSLVAAVLVPSQSAPLCSQNISHVTLPLSASILFFLSAESFESDAELSLYAGAAFMKIAACIKNAYNRNRSERRVSTVGKETAKLSLCLIN
jgi:hypothetical protein